MTLPFGFATRAHSRRTADRVSPAISCSAKTTMTRSDVPCSQDMREAFSGWSSAEYLRHSLSGSQSCRPHGGESAGTRKHHCAGLLTNFFLSGILLRRNTHKAMGSNVWSGSSPVAPALFSSNRQVFALPCGVRRRECAPRAVAQLASAFGSGPKSRRFKSGQPDFPFPLRPTRLSSR
jgi:hypothetical protein